MKMKLLAGITLATIVSTSSMALIHEPVESSPAVVPPLAAGITTPLFNPADPRTWAATFSSPANVPAVVRPAFFAQFMNPQFYMGIADPNRVAAMMNPQTYLGMASPQALQNWMSPASYSGYANPALYLQKFQPAQYMAMMNPGNFLAGFSTGSGCGGGDNSAESCPVGDQPGALNPSSWMGGFNSFGG